MVTAILIAVLFTALSIERRFLLIEKMLGGMTWVELVAIILWLISGVVTIVNVVAWLLW